MGTALTVCMKKNYINFIRQIPYYMPFYVNNPPKYKKSAVSTGILSCRSRLALFRLFDCLHRNTRRHQSALAAGVLHGIPVRVE